MPLVAGHAGHYQNSFAGRNLGRASSSGRSHYKWQGPFAPRSLLRFVATTHRPSDRSDKVATQVGSLSCPWPLFFRSKVSLQGFRQIISSAGQFRRQPAPVQISIRRISGSQGLDSCISTVSDTCPRPNQSVNVLLSVQFHER